MTKLTKSQERHQKLKADSEIIPKLFIMIESITKEIAIIKKKVNSLGDDDWCLNDGSYYGDKLYKVKYYCGVTEVSYGSKLDWQTFESAQEQEEYYHDQVSEDPFISNTKNDNFIEYYQLAELTLSKNIEKKLESIEELIKKGH